MKKTVVGFPKQEKKNYPKEAFEALYKIEDKHFWFAVRQEVIKIIINKNIKQKKDHSFLEIGCGTGIVLLLLEKLGFSVTGLDIHREGLRLARKRTGAQLLYADIYKLKEKNKYENIGLFDVIEHVDNDALLLRTCRNMLIDGGRVVITVPADMRLWSRMDEASGHKRRYMKRDLINLLQKSGFKVEYSSYFNFLLYIPQFLFRRLSDIQMKKETQRYLLIEELRLPPFPINFLLKWLLLIESQILRVIPIPFGTSLIVVGSKKD